MSRVVVAGIVEFPPEVRDEALIKGKELIEGAYTEKGCIHYLWTADLNHPGRVVVYEEWESGADLATLARAPRAEEAPREIPASFESFLAFCNFLRTKGAISCTAFICSLCLAISVQRIDSAINFLQFSKVL